MVRSTLTASLPEQAWATTAILDQLENLLPQFAVTPSGAAFVNAYLAASTVIPAAAVRPPSPPVPSRPPPTPAPSAPPHGHLSQRANGGRKTSVRLFFYIGRSLANAGFADRPMAKKLLCALPFPCDVHPR